MEGIFEKASRAKLRFSTPRGVLSVEDVWELPLKGGNTNLDDIAKALHRETKDDSEMSFVDDPPEPNEELLLKFSVVKHVIGVRLEEQKAAANAEANRQRKQQILAIIADKETESLKRKGIDKLRALVEDL